MLLCLRFSIFLDHEVTTPQRHAEIHGRVANFLKIKVGCLVPAVPNINKCKMPGSYKKHKIILITNTLSACWRVFQEVVACHWVCHITLLKIKRDFGPKKRTFAHLNYSRSDQTRRRKAGVVRRGPCTLDLDEHRQPGLRHETSE